MKKILYISLLTLFFVGCDDRLEDLNTDKRNPAEVDPTSLFTQALRETFDMMVSISVNDNPFNLYSQFWAQTTYPEESQYDLTGRSIPANFWTNGYRDALIDFKESKRLIQEQMETESTGLPNAVLMNRIAAIDIMSAYVYAVMVDVFGDIPYTEALDPDNLNPKYDDARTIYSSVIDSLDMAVSNIDTDEAGFPVAQDPLYEGNMENWVLFANSLKLRLGMRLADVDKPASVTIVNEALSAGVFSSNDDNASMTYYGASPNTNPIYEDLVLSGRADFIAANTVVDVMNDLDDPRRSVFFRKNLGGNVFNGGIYGTANNYSAFTQVGDILHTPDFPGTIMNYAEVEFLQAEALERGGYNAMGTAASHYNAGIEASFNQWGLSDLAYAAYIAQPEVNYATASGDWKQKLGIQLWLALYNQGFEAWTTWRRLDFDAFNAPPELTLEQIPLRFTYPLEEAQLNGPNYLSAGEKIGGDAVSTQIFWDVN
jgi:hypothetical protein